MVFNVVLWFVFSILVVVVVVVGVFLVFVMIVCVVEVVDLSCDVVILLFRFKLSSVLRMFLVLFFLVDFVSVLVFRIVLLMGVIVVVWILVILSRLFMDVLFL